MLVEIVHPNIYLFTYLFLTFYKQCLICAYFSPDSDETIWSMDQYYG